mmetsp:Transcript_52922/g.141429  ORF Transcript_52922/g.141429 Transcript_52922/m.141429 type:complete len:145 (-) Transcript_52922:305-739(-)
MLLICGPVTKQHFLLPLIGLIVCFFASIIFTVLPYVVEADFSFWSIQLIAYFGVVLCALQLVVFFLMWLKFGWRPTGVSRTVYKCNYCQTSFGTFNEASEHERHCPFRGQAFQGVPVAMPQHHVIGAVAHATPIQGTPVYTNRG